MSERPREPAPKTNTLLWHAAWTRARAHRAAGHRLRAALYGRYADRLSRRAYANPPKPYQ